MMMLPLFLKFLLLPLLAIGGALVIGFIQKKNALLNKKQLIIFVLAAALILALPGFSGLAGASFIPWCYLVSQALFVCLGIIYVQVFERTFGNNVSAYKVLFDIVFTTVILLAGGYVYVLFFNLVSELRNGYSNVSCMFPFIIPFIFYRAYVAYINIPHEIYKIWRYPVGILEADLDGMDFSKLMVLELEFSKEPSDMDRMRVKAKAPASLTFGDWFHKFLEDYNYKFPGAPVSYSDANGDVQGWIFYIKPSFLRRRRYIDPDLSILNNRIREQHTIVSKRVIEKTELVQKKSLFE